MVIDVRTKKSNTEEILEKIYNYSLEYIMGERFGRYSKYIIQDRAIPDVRDGLKPVQRRILYAMYIGHNTYDKAYRKSAKTVGDVIGSFHPHGDTSIYDAMVRLSQSWKIKNPLIDMHGNNGSIDGDSPAAYRYTEARLSKISSEMLKDIEKRTVSFAPNFDDTIMEPTVLPAKFPNLLVNGTTGISAGYATNIPPHNLGEIIDATIMLIDKPSSTLEDVMQVVLGPDFPTGGVVYDKKGIYDAFKTGKGRVYVRGKVSFDDEKGKNNIIITEIPYDVLKVNIVKKMDEIRLERKIDGIVEVRDESDKDGLRIVIELKKDANRDLILNYFYKNTDLQTTYNYNMIAIVNRRPKLLGIIDILNSYINHLKEVIINRTNFDLEHAKLRYHIVDGLIKAISILDSVIRVIRSSKNKQDAKENLVKEFDFTIEQAEAIVTLQLYRLTNTDIKTLEEEKADLQLKIEAFTKILSDEKALKYIMKKELKAVKDEYNVPRLTSICDTFEEIKIDTNEMIIKEDVIVLITKDGYVKRTSKRGYLSNNDAPLLKDLDYIIGLYELNTKDVVLLFTNKGNYLYLPVHEIPDIKWKVLGKHISNIIKIDENEQIIGAIPVSDFDKNKNIVLASLNGMIKKTPLNLFKVSRYTKPISCMKLKDKDEVIFVGLDDFKDINLTTNTSYNLWFSLDEVPDSGIKSSGVKAVALKKDYVVSYNIFNKEENSYLTVFTDKETCKRIKLTDLEMSQRARRGTLVIRDVKTNPHKTIKALISNASTSFGIKTNEEITYVKNTDFPILDRFKTGMKYINSKVLDVFYEEKIKLKDKMPDEKTEDNLNDSLEKEEVKNVQISLSLIDEKLKDIDNIIK